MASTARQGVRVDLDLIHQAADRHHLDTSNVSEVLRFALALAAGVDNPRSVAAMRRGPKQRPATA